ncbi:Acetoin dehydrogenase E1 component alpha-subunit [Streptococcus sp. DD12]|nr:Acetoin dehydrogenase E1 component alpha-subunit [Streptococcus sp. DD12]
MSKLTKTDYLEMFVKMQQIRDVDMTLNKLVRRGFVQGMTHFSVGEEAASVGAIQPLTDQDIIFQITVVMVRQLPKVSILRR